MKYDYLFHEMYYFEILDFSLSENQTKKQYTKKIKYQILKNKTKVLFLIQNQSDKMVELYLYYSDIG